MIEPEERGFILLVEGPHLIISSKNQNLSHKLLELGIHFCLQSRLV